MEMNVSEADGVTVVSLAGRLDTAGVTAIETGFAGAILPSGRSAVIDLAGLEFMTSLGIRMLISTARALAGRGGKLVLCSPGPEVREIIQYSALDSILPVAGGQAAALDLVKG